MKQKIASIGLVLEKEPNLFGMYRGEIKGKRVQIFKPFNRYYALYDGADGSQWQVCVNGDYVGEAWSFDGAKNIVR